MVDQSLTDEKTKTKTEKIEAFLRLEQLRKKRTEKEPVMDYDAELASYRENKYGKWWKRVLEKSSTLVYNLLRKVIGCDSDLPSV